METRNINKCSECPFIGDYDGSLGFWVCSQENKPINYSSFIGDDDFPTWCPVILNNGIVVIANK